MNELLFADVTYFLERWSALFRIIFGRKTQMIEGEVKMSFRFLAPSQRQKQTEKKQKQRRPNRVRNTMSWRSSASDGPLGSKPIRLTVLAANSEDYITAPQPLTPLLTGKFAIVWIHSILNGEGNASKIYWNILRGSLDTTWFWYNVYIGLGTDEFYIHHFMLLWFSIPQEMTLVDCQTIMCNLASLIWPSLERASTMIATTAYDACQSAIPRGRNPVQERHIRIW